MTMIRIIKLWFMFHQESSSLKLGQLNFQVLHCWLTIGLWEKIKIQLLAYKETTDHFIKNTCTPVNSCNYQIIHSYGGNTVHQITYSSRASIYVYKKQHEEKNLTRLDYSMGVCARWAGLKTVKVKIREKNPAFFP